MSYKYRVSAEKPWYKVALIREEQNGVERHLVKGKHILLEFCNACILLNNDESKSGKKYSNKGIA